LIFFLSLYHENRVKVFLKHSDYQGVSLMSSSNIKDKNCLACLKLNVLFLKYPRKLNAKDYHHDYLDIIKAQTSK
jgi:hypothetical protein